MKFAKTTTALLFIPVLFLSAAPYLRAQSSPEAKTEKLVSLMVGKWVGTTTYHRALDPRMPAPKEGSPVETRATWITITSGKTAGSIVLQVMSDEIDKIIPGEMTMRFDLVHGRVSYIYKGDASGRSFEKLEGVDDLLAKGGGQLIAMEHDSDSNQQRRMTISLTRNLWIRELETRGDSSAPWTVEQRILLTRDQPSASSQAALGERGARGRELLSRSATF